MNRFTVFGSLEAKWIQISLGFLCTALIFSLNIIDNPIAKKPINTTNFVVYDFISSLHLHPYKEITKVFVVDIDDYSIGKEGRWPWPRDKLATILFNLQNAGVVAVGLDIIMTNPEINYAIGLKDKLSTISELVSINPNAAKKEFSSTALERLLEKLAPEVDNDQLLAQTMKNYDVTLGFLFHNLLSTQNGLLPQPLINAEQQLISPKEFDVRYFHGYNASLALFMTSAGHGGFVTNVPDSDDIIRRGQLLGSIDDKVYASLALMSAMRFLLAEHIDLKKHKTLVGDTLYGLDVAGTFVPTTPQAEILIPFWGLQFTLPYISATDILHQNFAADNLAGAVAIIGSSALMLGDIHPSPVSRAFPGVEMVANMVAGIIGQQLITPYDWLSFSGVAILISYGLVIAVLFAYLGTLLLTIITFLLCLALLGLCVYFYSAYSMYVPIGSLFILTALIGMLNYSYGFILEKRQRYKIKQLFGQYVPPGYVNELISAKAMSMEGETRELSVLFSDIRSFTSTSEGLDATNVKRLLNTFFTPITEIIFDHQGTIDKYVGDMVVAFWGAPIPIEGHARQAVLAALKIFKDLPAINELMMQNELPAVNIGIGIGTGLMNVGDMGSKFRRAYTVLGDNVNLASRLEGLTKYYGVNILVNDLTREQHDEFLWRAVDRVAVKGRKTGLTIYEPLGLLSETPQTRMEEINLYHQALELYHAQNWSAAAVLFQQLQQQYPDTYLYQLYSARIQRYQQEPPPEHWDGIFVHTEK